MQYRTLGKTKLQVSAFALGTWELGGLWWGPLDAKEGVGILHRALELGVNTFDSSDAYGNGRAEVIMGEAFRGKRNQAIIVTKVGYLVGIDGAQKLFQERGAPQLRCLESWYIRNECELSLRRLQTDYIDVYLLHDPSVADVKKERPWATLQRLKEQGKVRFIGLSAGAAACLQAVKDGRVDVIETPYNVLTQDAARELFPLCQQKGVGVLARSPFATGRLFQGGEQVEKIKAALVKPPVSSLTEAAIKFVLSRKEVATCITGVMNVSELAANVKAAEPPYFTAAQLKTVQAV
jgi:methylglyoxal reductase